MSIIKRAWKGEAKLWHVFWGGLLLQQILTVIAGFIFGLCVGFYASGAGWDKAQSRLIIDNALHSATSFVLISTFYVLMSICVWRCSWNASHKAWGYLARVAIIIITLLMMVNIPLRLGKENAATVQAQGQGHLNGIARQTTPVAPAVSADGHITVLTEPSNSAADFFKVNMACNQLFQQRAVAENMTYDDYLKMHTQEMTECKNHGWATGIIP